MPLFILIVGIMFLTATVRGKEQQDKLWSLLRSDFTGPGNFLVWAIAIGGLSAIGYYPPARRFSNLFLTLVFVVLILTKKSDTGQDFMTSFISQIRSSERTVSK